MSINKKLCRRFSAFLPARPRPSLVSIFAFTFIFSISTVAAAGPATCLDLVNPLDNKVRSVKERGGLWGLFEKARALRDHSPMALQMDSKVISLIFTLNYLCETEKGIPYDELALYLNSRFNERGGEGPVRDELLNMGYSIEEVAILLEFKKFAERSRHRQLDLNQIRKTIEKADIYAERYWLLAQKMKKRSGVSMVEEVKALARDIAEFRATDPYMKQADYENAQVPHTTLTESSDQM